MAEIDFDDEDWDAVREVAAAMGTDRAEVVNQFFRWYLHRPGAELPERPEQSAVTERLNAARAANREAEGTATELNMTRQGAEWARRDASADELEYLATYDGDPGEFQTPASLINFARQWDLSNEPLGAGMPDSAPGDSHVPLKPSEQHWPSFQAGAREIWETASRF